MESYGVYPVCGFFNSALFLISTHVCVYINSSSLLLWGSISLLNIPQFIHSPVDGHLFPPSSFEHSHISRCRYVCTFLGQIPWREILGPLVSECLT